MLRQRLCYSYIWQKHLRLIDCQWDSLNGTLLQQFSDITCFQSSVIHHIRRQKCLNYETINWNVCCLRHHFSSVCHLLGPYLFLFVVWGSLWGLHPFFFLTRDACFIARQACMCYCTRLQSAATFKPSCDWLKEKASFKVCHDTLKLALPCDFHMFSLFKFLCFIGWAHWMGFFGGGQQLSE